MMQQIVDIEGWDSDLLTPTTKSKRKRQMTLTIFSAQIAGVSHAKPDFEQINAEDEVILIKEPHNPVDRNAIKIQHKDAGKLGYIPKESTVCLHDAWANGFTLHAFVTYATQEKFPKIGLRVMGTIG